MPATPEAPPLRVALLRGVNVGGHARLPMAELRDLCADVGWTDARTYIQSGNLIFRAVGERATLERELESAIEERFGLAVPAIVRDAAEWRAYVDDNPFPEAAEAQPNLVMLALSKAPPEAGAAERLEERGTLGERVVRVRDALWIHFVGGAGRSKLSPTLLDRHAGSPVTTRNWRTVLKLLEMTAEKGD